MVKGYPMSGANREMVKNKLFLKNNCYFYGCKEKKQYICR